MARLRGVALRTAASVLGVRRGPAAAGAGPRPRDGHSVARRCAAAILGVPLPPAPGPAAAPASPLHPPHGWTQLIPSDLGDPPRPPAHVPAPPGRRVAARRHGPRRWPGWLLVTACAAAVLTAVLPDLRPASHPFPRTVHVSPVSPGALFPLLPRRIQQAGRLVVGTARADLAPMVFTDGGTLTGLDTDLLNALAVKLGIPIVRLTADRSSLVAGVTDGRFDVAAAGLTDTPSRQRYVDFVDYFTAGSVVTVAAANPDRVRSLADLCGRTVAVIAHGADAALVSAQKCAAAPVEVVGGSSAADVLQRVRTGEADASFTDFPSAVFAAGQPGSRLLVVGEQIGPGPYGFAVAKDDPQLRQALAAALDAVIEDGTYERILQKYRLAEGAVGSAQVDGGR
ncbi:ABC transporter substrate-binding protein [Streptomyces sp. V4-01]|uniref:ABC transporter substrate-binding protein n=1 Tax=Actinacidiphila polyblastidii TaxID=3110430 RepID=A0ABU7P3P3_9ACTN|nr:ABC transporter substrate-binding protein [Streptomyces sp. V4-01]